MIKTTNPLSGIKQTIAILHYQVGYNDGVSLEIEKWKTVLESMGHKVIRVAGDLGSQDGVLIPDLYHHDPEIEWINRNLFGKIPGTDAKELKRLIVTRAKRIEAQLKEAFMRHQISLIIPNNIWSVALNLPAAIALENVCNKLQLPAIAHHHDFYWESKGKASLTRDEIRDLMEKYLPPRSELITHVVINSLAKAQLLERKGLESIIVPNVLDFDSSEGAKDSYNQDLRKVIGIKENDVLILQATRIIPRKGIEIAIELIKELNSPHYRNTLRKMGLFHGGEFTEDSAIVLVLAGNDMDDPTGNYLKRLTNRAESSGVEIRVISHLINHSRTLEEGTKQYSLWDAYAIADLVTYPSLWEGWGNQLLEAIRAKLPVVTFEYPVFVADIQAFGIKTISLGSTVCERDQNGLISVPEEAIKSAAENCVRSLTEKEYRALMTGRNFEICRNNFSLSALKNHLGRLF